jgi:hypothetical protein
MHPEVFHINALNKLRFDRFVSLPGGAAAFWMRVTFWMDAFSTEAVFWTRVAFWMGTAFCTGAAFWKALVFCTGLAPWTGAAFWASAFFRTRASF